MSRVALGKGVSCGVQVPEAASYYSLEASTVSWKFPEPGFLEGVKTKDKAILKMTQMNFKYPGADKYILKDTNVQVMTTARCLELLLCAL
jgi:elongation factor 3